MPPRQEEQDASESEEYSIVILHNEIHFNGPVCLKSMSDLMRALLEVDAEIKANTRAVKRKWEEIDVEEETPYVKHKIAPMPIKLFLNTDGGEVHHALMVCDTIRRMETPVHTICTGLVASAGTLISICGVKRYITPNGYMLIHEVRSGMWGKYSEMIDEYENTKNLMKDIISLYVERTNLTKRQLKKMLKKDMIWDTATCLEYGLVDKILE